MNTTPTSAVLSPSGGIMQTAILSPTGTSLQLYNSIERQTESQ